MDSICFEDLCQQDDVRLLEHHWAERRSNCALRQNSICHENPAHTRHARRTSIRWRLRPSRVGGVRAGHSLSRLVSSLSMSEDRLLVIRLMTLALLLVLMLLLLLLSLEAHQLRYCARQSRHLRCQLFDRVCVGCSWQV